MDDLFYLNEKEVPINVFRDFIYNKFISIYENVKLNVYSDNFQINFSKNEQIVHCEWTFMKVEEFYEDTVFLHENQIVFIVMITHHTYELNLIMPIIKETLFEFGGMLGNDSDLFYPRFTLETIAEFRYAWEI